MIKRLIAIYLSILFAVQFIPISVVHADNLAVTVTCTHEQDSNSAAWTKSDCNLPSTTNWLVAVCLIGNDGASSFANGATWNSVSMTAVSGTAAKNTTRGESIIYQLQNPATGTQTFVFNLSTADDGACVLRGYQFATAISGGTSTGATLGVGHTLNVTCPATNGNQVISGVDIANVTAITTDASQTEILNADDGGGQYAFSSENSTGSPVAMSYTWTGGQEGVHAGVCVEGGGAASSVIPAAPIFFQ